jgi:hypothetical protein
MKRHGYTKHCFDQMSVSQITIGQMSVGQMVFDQKAWSVIMTSTPKIFSQTVMDENE